MIEVKDNYIDMDTAAEDAILDAKEFFSETEIDKIGKFLDKWYRAAGYKKIARWFRANALGEER